MPNSDLEQGLEKLGRLMTDDDPSADGILLAGYTYLGQFIDHDLTFDVTPLLQSRAGQTLRLRFEEQDSLFYMNVTLDNISLAVQTTPAAPDDDFYAVNLTSTVAATSPIFLIGFISGRGLFYAKLSAAATLASLPVLLAGWVAQRQLIRGLTMGAVK